MKQRVMFFNHWKTVCYVGLFLLDSTLENVELIFSICNILRKTKSCSCANATYFKTTVDASKLLVQLPPAPLMPGQPRVLDRRDIP